MKGPGFSFAFLSIMFLLASAPFVYAEVTEAGVSFPETKQLEDSSLVLNGTGTRKATIFKVRVYAAALYVKEKSDSPETLLSSATPSHLSMQFVRSVGAEKLQDGWKTGLQKNSSNFKAIQGELDQFNGKMKDVSEGDRIEISFYPKEKVIVSVSGDEPFEIVHSQFPADLLAVWIGESPPNKDLKTGLLGKAS